MSRVTLVVPCYNEAERLDRAAFSGFRLDGHTLDFCFVDDGSRDGTPAVLEEVVARRGGADRVERLERNRGKAEAVRQGILLALQGEPDYVGFWDADLATPLEELGRFVAVLETHPLVLTVFGSRVKLLGRTIERRSLRHYLGRIFATTVSLTLALPVYDTQCGAKLFRACALTREIFAEPFLSRWIFDVELIARLKHRQGGRREPLLEQIYELPLDAWRDIGGSKLKSVDFLKAIGDLWRIRARYL